MGFFCASAVRLSVHIRDKQGMYYDLLRSVMPTDRLSGVRWLCRACGLIYTSVSNKDDRCRVDKRSASTKPCWWMRSAYPPYVTVGECIKQAELLHQLVSAWVAANRPDLF